jgi:hypothetical protein
VSRQETQSNPAALLPLASPLSKPASRQELCALGIYFAVVVVAADVLNVRLGVELLTVVVVLAAACISRSFVAFAVIGGCSCWAFSCGI